MLVWGMASLDAGSRPFFLAVAEKVLAAPSLAHYNSFTISNLAWSFGTVRISHACPPLLLHVPFLQELCLIPHTHAPSLIADT